MDKKKHLNDENLNESLIKTSINRKLVRFADELMNRYTADGMYEKMSFFHALGDILGQKGWNQPINNMWLRQMLEEFNSFMFQHQILGKVTEKSDVNLPFIFNDISMQSTTGKYRIGVENDVPCLLFTEPSNLREYSEQLIAITLTEFLLKLIDIRKVQEKDSKLNGLCEYISKIAPDEFYGYCKAGNNTSFGIQIDDYVYAKFSQRQKPS
ncbi:MAG: hypothetical protein GYA51_01540 [Candidatus Methanofastidiosa archaeon]|nr:hypothetical protein [Candidatus Methanofastidiosa archaeon]